MRHTITGQRQEDRARRTIVVGTIISIIPLLVPAGTIAAAWDIRDVIAATMLSTIGAACLVALLLMRMTRRLARQQADFEDERRRWRAEANTDPLCRIMNRRGAADRVDHLLATTPDDAPWTVVAFDVDHFKEVNDTHGHAVGDRVLAAVASVLSEHIPPDATVARWGGDEFVVFARGSVAVDDALARRLVGLLREHAVPSREGDLCIGMSYGLATVPGHVRFDDALAAADHALLAAKDRLRRGAPVAAGSPAATTTAAALRTGAMGGRAAPAWCA